MFAKRRPNGRELAIVKFDRACKGIDRLREGEARLFHVRARSFGTNAALQRAINGAYALAVARGLTGVVEELEGISKSCEYLKVFEEQVMVFCPVCFLVECGYANRCKRVFSFGFS